MCFFPTNLLFLRETALRCARFLFQRLAIQADKRLLDHLSWFPDVCSLRREKLDFTSLWIWAIAIQFPVAARAESNADHVRAQVQHVFRNWFIVLVDGKENLRILAPEIPAAGRDIIVWTEPVKHVIGRRLGEHPQDHASPFNAADLAEDSSQGFGIRTVFLLVAEAEYGLTRLEGAVLVPHLDEKVLVFFSTE